MKRIILAIIGFLALASTASAVDNYAATQGSGKTFRCLDVAGVCLPYFALADGTGTTVVYAQGSTTSGQSGIAILCRTLTAAPTDTTAQSNIPSCTTSGQLRTAGSLASGAVASGAFASGALASGSVASGAIVDLGAQADAAWVSGSGSLIAIAKTIATGTTSAIPAGTNLIGKVGIDQTTPGTTNKVAVTGNAGAAFDAATGAAPPANAIYLGANASGATGGHVAGLVSCDSHVFKHITTATDTLAVQGVASQTIYVCSWRSRAAGVATWFLENTASANANCSSANTQITGVATEAANTGETWGSNFWSGLKNTAGNGLCINSTGTGGFDIDIWYAQL